MTKRISIALTGCLMLAGCSNYGEQSRSGTYQTPGPSHENFAFKIVESDLQRMLDLPIKHERYKVYQTKRSYSMTTLLTSNFIEFPHLPTFSPQKILVADITIIGIFEDRSKAHSDNGYNEKGVAIGPPISYTHNSYKIPLVKGFNGLLKELPLNKTINQAELHIFLCSFEAYCQETRAPLYPLVTVQGTPPVQEATAATTWNLEATAISLADSQRPFTLRIPIKNGKYPFSVGSVSMKYVLRFKKTDASQVEEKVQPMLSPMETELKNDILIDATPLYLDFFIAREKTVKVLDRSFRFEFRDTNNQLLGTVQVPIEAH